MTEERNFLVVSENNLGEFGITFDWSVLETEADALTILGMLDRIKGKIHDMLDEVEYAMEDEEDGDGGEDFGDDDE